MNKKGYKHGVIGILISLSVVFLLVLAGPAGAVKIEIDNIGNGFLGDDIDFSFNVNIKDTDLLPVENLEVLINGPSDFFKECLVSLDGSDNCEDVDFIVSNNANSLEGNLVGVDGNNNAYDLGYGYGFSDGDIFVNGVWHTSDNLDVGAYSVNVNVNSEGSSGSKVFESNSKGFSLGVLTELSNWNKEIDIFDLGGKKIGKAQLKQTQTVNLIGPFNTPQLILNGQVLVDINGLGDLSDREIYEGWLVDESSDYELSLGSFKTVNKRGGLDFNFKGYFDAYDKVVISEEIFPDNDPSSSGIVVGVGVI
jgi:hypothetical protein